MTFRFTSAAESELAERIEYYRGIDSNLAAKFLDEIESSIDRLLMAPLLWRKLSERTRRCLDHLFPIGLFYHVKPDEILIVSVMDLRRDPENWKQYL